MIGQYIENTYWMISLQNIPLCIIVAAPRCSSDKIAHHSALTLPTFRWPSPIVWLQKMDVLFGSSGQQPWLVEASQAVSTLKSRPCSFLLTIRRIGA